MLAIKTKKIYSVLIFILLFISVIANPILNLNKFSNKKNINEEDSLNLQGNSLTDEFTSIFSWKSSFEKFYNSSYESLSLDSLVGNLTDFDPENSTSYTGQNTINITYQSSNSSWAHLRDYENDVPLPSTNLGGTLEIGHMLNPYDTSVFFARKGAEYNLTISWEDEVNGLGDLDTNLFLFNHSQFHDFENYIKPWRDPVISTVTDFKTFHNSDDWLYEYSNSIFNPSIFPDVLNDTIDFGVTFNKSGWYYLVVWGPGKLAVDTTDKPKIATFGDLLLEGTANDNIIVNDLMDMYRPSLGRVVGTITKPNMTYERVIHGVDEVYGDSIVLIYIFEFSNRQLQNTLTWVDYDWAPFIVYIDPSSVGKFPNRFVYFHDDSWADTDDRFIKVVDSNYANGTGTYNFLVNISDQFAPFLNETVKMSINVSTAPISSENHLGCAVRLATTTNSHGFEIKPYNETFGITYGWDEISKNPLDDLTLRNLYNDSIVEFLDAGWKEWSVIGLWYPEKTPFALYFKFLFKSPYLVSGLENLLLISPQTQTWIENLIPYNEYFNHSLDLEVNTTIDIPVNFTVSYPENEPGVGESCNITLALGAMGNPNITIDYRVNYSMDFSMILFTGSYDITKNDTIHFEIPLQEINYILGFFGVDDGLSGLASREFQKSIDTALGKSKVAKYVAIENFLLGSHVVGNLVSCDIRVHLWPIIKDVIKNYKYEWYWVCEIIDHLILNNQTGLDLIISPQLQGVVNGTIIGDGLDFDNGGIFEFNDTHKSVKYQVERTQDFSLTSIQLQSILYFLNFHIDWAFEVNFDDLLHDFGLEDLRWELGTYPTVDFAPTPMDDSDLVSLNWEEWAPELPSPPTLSILSPSPSSNHTVELEWTLSGGADNYTLYRNTAPITSSNLATSTNIITTTGDNWIDIVPGYNRWYYAVTAINMSGSSDPSNSEYIDIIGPSDMDFVWNRTYGTIDVESGEGVACDSEGNIFIVGSTQNQTAGFYDVLLIKYNSTGDYQWNKTWGGTGADYGYDVAVDSDNNIFVVGKHQNTTMSHSDMALIKFDKNGNEIWNRTWNKINTENEGGYSIALDSEENIFISGFAFVPGLDKQALVVKYSKAGQLQWNVTWGGSFVDEAFGIAVDSQDNCYITGTTGNEFQTFLIKYDPSGNEEWVSIERDWTSGGGNNLGRGVAVDSEDYIYVAGAFHNWTVGYTNDLILRKYDDTGNSLWNATWHWTNETNEMGFDVTIDSAGFIYVAGNVYPNLALRQQMAIIKFDNQGNLLWNTTWGGSGDDNAYGIDADSSINLYVTGTTESFGPGSPKKNIELIKLLINDTINPTVFLNSFDTQAEAGIGSINVQVNISDNYQIQSPVQIQFFEPDSTIIGTFDMNNPSGDLWNYTWDTGVYSLDYNYYFKIIAKDTSNNINDTIIDYFDIIDTTNPSVLIDNFDVQAEAGIGVINVQVNISDNYQLQSPVQIRFYEPDSTVIGTFDMNNPSGNVWNYIWNVGSYAPDSNYYFRIIANDTTGNVNNSVIEYFDIVDTTNPSVFIYSFDTQAEEDIGYINVNVNVSDNYQVQSPVQIRFYEPDSTVIGTFDMNNPSGNLWNYTWNVGIYVPDSNYYFRIIASDASININDTVLGYFNITEAPEFGPPISPILTITTPSPTTILDIAFDWTPSIGADNYSLYRYTSPITSSNLNLTTFIITTTESNTTDTVPGIGIWYYTVIATNESGSSIPSNSPYIDVQEEQIPPNPPILTITTPSPTISLSVALEWTTSEGADNYSLYRHTSPITSSNLNLTTFIVTIIENTTTDIVPGIGRWYYVVVAINESGSSDPSNYDFIDIEKADPPLPPVLTITTTSPTTSLDISLDWTLSIGADNYTLYRYTSPIISSNLHLATEVKTITETTTTDTVPGIGRWYYAIVATNETGNSELSNYDFIDVEAPTGGGSGAIPGYPLYIIELLAVSMIFIVYMKKFRKKLNT